MVAHPTIVDWLINTGRSYIYTTASSPAQAHAVLKSLQLIEGEEGAQRRAHLRGLVQQLRAAPSGAWRQRCWSWADSSTAIQPLMIGDNGAALRLSTSLEAEGLWVPAIRPPTVPVGTARLRITLSAAHTTADVDRLLTSLTRAAGASP